MKSVTDEIKELKKTEKSLYCSRWIKIIFYSFHTLCIYNQEVHKLKVAKFFQSLSVQNNVMLNGYNWWLKLRETEFNRDISTIIGINDPGLH